MSRGLDLPSPRTRRGPWSAVLMTLLLVGCSGIDVDTEAAASATPEQWSTWAWASGNSADSDVAVAVREAVDVELERRGMRRTDPIFADVLVRQLTTIHSEIRHPHPSVALYPMERIEHGTLTLEFVDPATSEAVWRGSGSSKLRVAAVMLTPMATEMTESSSPRVWKVQETVYRILDELRPLEDG